MYSAVLAPSARDAAGLDLEQQEKLEILEERLRQEAHAYLIQHPELRQVLNDFMSSLLLHRPDDVYAFSRDFFEAFKDDEEVDDFDEKDLFAQAAAMRAKQPAKEEKLPTPISPKDEKGIGPVRTPPDPEEQKVLEDTDAPAEATEVAAEVTKATETPAEATEAPAEPTKEAEAPAEATEEPTEEAPAEAADAPAEAADAPAEAVEAPAEATEAPADATVDTADAPADTTEAPVDPAEVPTDTAEAPAAEAPTDTAEAPAAEAPADTTEAPAAEAPTDTAETPAAEAAPTEATAE